MLILKKLNKASEYVKTCLLGTFFFVIKLMMSKKLKLSTINKTNKNTLMESLKIEITDVGDDYLVAKMPVNQSVYQPEQVLHGRCFILHFG
jgi:Uncharacterized protein, possibly involved in aromatic compounds catabolism